MQSRTVRTAVAAAVVAAAIGLVLGIYGITRGSGNAELAATCTGSEARAAALDGVNVGHMAAFTPADEPKYLGDMAFKGRDGGELTLADWKGRTVLVNLWATWCAPCREEMPSLQALQGAMGGEAFEVVPVSIDLGDPVKPLNFYEEIGLDGLGFYHDGSMGVFNTAKRQGLAFGLPTTMLIDVEGCVIGALNGPADWASDDAKALVARALGS